MTAFPMVRPRRIRQSSQIRKLVCETGLTVEQLVYPLFIDARVHHRTPISSLPGVDQLSLDDSVEEAASVVALGIPAIMLFGTPTTKDPQGSAAWDCDGIVAQAVRAIKQEFPELVVFTDVCLCSYTTHGHCGVLSSSNSVGDSRADAVDNDASLPLLARVAVAHAGAGADGVAPSDMMDGRIGAIRTALDENGFSATMIMAHSAKFASAFYGPFRRATDCGLAEGDRRGYQLDPGNRLAALREVELDIAEGADIVMVKPALPYLDVIRSVKDCSKVPVAAYSVGGEYAMIKSAAAAGVIDERMGTLEALLAIRRAGADIIITYHAKAVAQWLQ